MAIDGYNFNGATSEVTLNGLPQIVGAGADPSKNITATLGSYSVTASVAADTFTTAANHNLRANAKVRFNATGMPAPLTALTQYYVVGGTLTATTFQVSLTSGGAAINLTTAGTAVVVVSGSGEVIVETAGVESQNNLNDNTLTQNLEANNINNNLLTDDRSLVVWDITSVTNTGDMRNLDFELNPTTNSLNFSAGSQDVYFSLFRDVVGSTAVANNLRNSYTRYFDNRMAFNTSGTVFSVAQCADSANVPVNGWTLPSHFGIHRGFATGTNLNEYANVQGTGILYLESNWNGAALNNLTRIQGPSLKITGADALSKVYMSYYDATQKLIKFRYGEMGTAGFTAGYTTNANMGAITSTFLPYRSVSNAVGTYNASGTEQAVSIYTSGSVYNQGFVAIAGFGANSSQSAVGVTSTGTAIVAWYDQVGGDLKVKYNTAPATSFSAYQSFTNRTDTVPAAGTYTFKLRINGTLVNSGNDLSVTVATPAQGTRRHQLAYQLGLLLSANASYNSYAEIDPVTSRVTIRTLQTGVGQTVSIEAPTAGTSLITQMTSVQTAVNGIGNNWVERTVDADAAGKNVSMTIDSNDGVHFSYQNTTFGDLRYAYLADVTGGSPVVLNVDTYGQVGQHSEISTFVEDINNDGDTEIVPYISYYSIAFSGTPYSLRQARLMVDSINTVGDGTSTALSGLNGAATDRYTGNWEVMAVPAIQSPNQYRVNSSLTSTGDLYYGYQVDDTTNPIEYSRRR